MNTAPHPNGEPAATQIDVQQDAEVERWAKKLDTTAQQVKDAVAAVGPSAADVEMHLKGSHSTTNSEAVQKAS